MSSRLIVPTASVLVGVSLFTLTMTLLEGPSFSVPILLSDVGVAHVGYIRGDSETVFTSEVASDGSTDVTRSTSIGVSIDRKVERVVPDTFTYFTVKFGSDEFVFDSEEYGLYLDSDARIDDVMRAYDMSRDTVLADYRIWLESFNEKVYQQNEDGARISSADVPGFYYYRGDYRVDVDLAVERVDRALMERIEGDFSSGSSIELNRIYKPGTGGEYTDEKYIELDHRRQRLYAWENGRLYKEWEVSGFYDYYAVFGVFDIINQSELAWSPIAEKWMPYWMAFYYDGRQEAWFGLHELVWWYDETGAYREESSDSIGNMKSGGCVRLDRGEMVELYEWVDIGSHFLIYQ